MIGFSVQLQTQEVLRRFVYGDATGYGIVLGSSVGHGKLFFLLSCFAYIFVLFPLFYRKYAGKYAAAALETSGFWIVNIVVTFGVLAVMP